MFLQLVYGTGVPAADLHNGHPRWITALVEHYWRNRVDNLGPGGRGNWAWPAAVIDQTLREFGPGLPGTARSPNRFEATSDHIVYAWLVENTRIYDIFAKILKTYRSGEQLGSPNRSRQFWDITERLFFSPPPPDTVSNVTSTIRPDEIAQRMSTYWWMVGLPLAHAAEIAQAHPYQKPAGANTEFILAFESFAKEVRRGIVNSQNTQGANDTDNGAIACETARIRDMFATCRQNGNLFREEFRAVVIMSWLHLAVSDNSPAVQDLGADASSEDQRLSKMAARVGMTPHPKSGALFALAYPFSNLLTAIERGRFRDSQTARLLYMDPGYRALVETVIGQYSYAMGRDLKAMPVAVSEQEPLPERQLLPPRPQLVASNQQAGNSGQAAQPRAN